MTRRSIPFRLLVLLLVLFAAGEVALITPPGLGPDEPAVVDYAAFLARERRLPESERDDVFQAQHPPLYHATLAVAGELLAPLGETVGATTWSPPLERDLELRWDRGAAPDRGPLERYPYLPRFIGLLFALVSVLFVLASVPVAQGRGLLAAAALLLVPQFAISFATPSNDQLAILLSCAALFVALGGGTAMRRQFVVSFLFGLGFLAKATVIGPFLFAWLLGVRRAEGARERVLTSLRLALGPLLIAGWWYLRRIRNAGDSLGVELAALRHPGILRHASPDAWEVQDLLAGFVETGLGASAGVGLPAWWLPIALLIPFALLLALPIGLRARDPELRAIAFAFLLGGGALIALLLLGNRYFFYTHGRYFLVMVTPAALVLSGGIQQLAREHARALLAGLCLIATLSGILFVHARLLPRYGVRIEAPSPGLIVDLDLGGPDASALRKGSRRLAPPAELLDAESRMVVGRVEKGVALSLALPPGTNHRFDVLSLRRRRVGGEGDGALFAHGGVRVGERIGGWFSAAARSEIWDHFALPSTEGERRLDVIGPEGTLLGLSRLRIRQLPFRFLPSKGQDGGLRLRYRVEESGWPRRFVLGAKGSTATWSLETAPGEHDLEIEGLDAKAQLELRLSGVTLGDLEVAAFVGEERREGDERAPSGWVVPFSEGSDIVPLPAAALPRSYDEVVFLDAEGKRCDGFRLQNGAVRRSAEGTTRLCRVVFVGALRWSLPVVFTSGR